MYKTGGVLIYGDSDLGVVKVKNDEKNDEKIVKYGNKQSVWL